MQKKQYNPSKKNNEYILREELVKLELQLLNLKLANEDIFDPRYIRFHS